MCHSKAELHQTHRRIVRCGRHRHLAVAFDDLGVLLLFQFHNGLGPDGSPALGSVLGSGKLAPQGRPHRRDHIVGNQDGCQLPPGTVGGAAGFCPGSDAPHRGHHAPHVLQRRYAALNQQVNVIVTVNAL